MTNDNYDYGEDDQYDENGNNNNNNKNDNDNSLKDDNHNDWLDEAIKE